MATEDTVDVDNLRLNPTSCASKMGDGGADSSELERSSSSTAFSLYGRKWPPWMGGRKLVQLPSIEPIWNLLMVRRVSCECRLGNFC